MLLTDAAEVRPYPGEFNSSSRDDASEERLEEKLDRECTCWISAGEANGLLRSLMCDVGLGTGAGLLGGGGGGRRATG